MRRLLAALAILTCSAAPARALTTPALLDTLQHSAFDFFWNEAHPVTGLIKDRNTPGSVASIASQGFGFTAACIGIDRGYITRAQGRERVLKQLRTYWWGVQGTAASGMIGYKGLFYHWLDPATGTRTWDAELSTIDTALLLAGVLDVGRYFDQADSQEVAIRELADSLYLRADWDFMRNGSAGIRMGWKPGTGFLNFGLWRGYNEAMILYLLALGSPTHPVPANAWNYWISGYQWQTLYGYSFVTFPPLFGHQYSHCWVDFRDQRDPYMQLKDSDYFENSRRATLAQRAYSIQTAPPSFLYTDSLWGITASDYPGGYLARGAPPAQNDEGTIVPTAAFSSVPFTPNESYAVMHHLWNVYRSLLWGPYGFVDAVNLSYPWWATDVIGIDQGPILIMIENHRTESVWNRFMQSPYIQTGMQRAGFVDWSLVGVESQPAGALWLSSPEPNPARGRTTLHFRLPSASDVRLSVFDVQGRELAVAVEGRREAGVHSVNIPTAGWRGGVYFARLEAQGETQTTRIVHLGE